MHLTATDVHWMLIHTTSSLPYVVIMCYLAWVHVRAVRSSPSQLVPAMVTAFFATMLAAGGFVWNQPPFRFMVSGELNGMVKDVILVVQACLVGMFSEQLRGRTTVRLWVGCAVAGVVPIAMTVATYLNGGTIKNDVVQVPWSVTLYALALYAYAGWSFWQLLTGSRGVVIRARLRTLLLGVGAVVVYVAGRGIMPVAPDWSLHALVWVNRITLTAGTLFMTLGMAMPEWYRRLSGQVSLIRHASVHVGRLIGLLGLVTDLELRLKTNERVEVRNTALAVGERLGFALEQLETLWHLAMLVPMEGLAVRRAGAPTHWYQEPKVDLVESVALYGHVYDILARINNGEGYAFCSEAHVLQAAWWYIEGRSLAEIEQAFPPAIVGALESSAADHGAAS